MQWVMAGEVWKCQDLAVPLDMSEVVSILCSEWYLDYLEGSVMFPLKY